MAGPRLAAHRGGAALWPENSLAAFAGALALGIDLLELDVHLSADDEVVVIHDATLERTTDGTGAVRAQAATALRRLHLRGPDGAVTGERLPLLDDVLALVAPSSAGLLVEMKGPATAVRYGRGTEEQVEIEPGPMYPGLEERVLARLEAAGMTDRATIMAFNPAVLVRVRSLAPAWRTTLLVARGDVERAGARATDTLEWATRLGVTDLGLEQTLVDADVVAGAHARGLLVGAWTANDERTLRRLFALGVDVVTADRPDIALTLREPNG